MECVNNESFLEIERIAGDYADDPPRSIKELLCTFAGALSLDGLTFSLFDPRLNSFSRRIKSSGPELFLPSAGKAVGNPLSVIWQERWPDPAANELHLSVGHARTPCGILTLCKAAPILFNNADRQLLQVLCSQLAVLAQAVLLAESERQRIQQQALLAELGRELNRASTLRGVMQGALGVIRRQTKMACIILRPLHGDTVLGSPRVWVAPPSRALRPFFLQLEEKQTHRALGGQSPLFRHNLGTHPDTLLPLPSSMVTVPLVFQKRSLGGLTLFGGDAEDSIPGGAGTEAKRFWSVIGSQIAQALERVTTHERLAELSSENDRKLHEATLLFRIARAMQSTLRLNELMHLILSAAAVAGGGGFERAMLFMLNERSGILQGMLCVTRETASLVLPAEGGLLAWEHPVVNVQAQEVQRQCKCCRQVVRQRLPLQEDNALARAARMRRIVFVPNPEDEPPSAAALAKYLDMAPYVCAPLFGRHRPLGVLVVDNFESREEITPDRLRFLELFANLAGAAMENSMLLDRLETAHQDLRETQERLIQGEKLAVLGEMAASVTHELRNPLVAIGGFAQRLSRVAVGAQEKEYAGVIAREVQRMEAMLSNILDFSKKEMLCFGECQLLGVIEEALSIEYDALLRGSVQLVTELPASLPVIQGDEQKLRQVMINLLANARQAMPAGGVLTIRAYLTTLRGDTAVTIEVEDTGGGIPADILRNIFNPFFTTKEGGTGLGLPISHRIVEQHRGRIEVQNRDQGAVFILRLPVRAASAPFR